MFLHCSHLGGSRETGVDKDEHSGTVSPNVRLAAATIVFTVFALSFGDALIKFTSGDFVIWQIFVLRSLIALPVLLVAALLLARQELRLPRARFWTAARSFMLVAMWIAYYAALPHLQLSAAAAAYYTLPIFIVLFSALFVGDRIAVHGWAAVVLGFAGILLILRPQASDFNLYALLPVMSAMLYAAAMIVTNRKCADEHPLMLALWLNISFVLAGLAATGIIYGMALHDRAGFLLSPWTAMNGWQWGVMAVMAASVLIGSVGNAIAYQNGPPSIVGTFDFAYVGFTVLWGFLLFQEVPDVLKVAGMSMIVIAGMIALRR